MNNQHKNELIKVLGLIGDNPKLLNEFLKDLLTSSEYRELEVRWQIVKKLYNEIPQRQIAYDLGVGIATVSRGARELQDRQGGFQQVLKKLNI